MPLPKGFRKNVKLVKPKVGPERRQELLDDIDNQGTFLPKGVMYEDMDKSFIDMVKNDLKIDIDGEKVPVIFLTIQRWAEFSQTWQSSDKFKDVSLPFITIVRKPDVQMGTNQSGNWNVPQGRKTYTYVKVPTFDGGKKGVDTYKIQQPTSVDITYEVRLFCNKMKDLNKLYSVVHQTFQARQHYIKPNGHYMPVIIENIGDESSVDDFENRRFYVQLFEMKLQGYLLDSDKFEIIPTINKALVVEEVISNVNFSKPKLKIYNDSSGFNYKFLFKPNSDNFIEFKVKDKLTIYEVNNVNNLKKMSILYNNVEVDLPFSVAKGGVIRLDIVKENVNNNTSFMLNGK